MDKAYGGPQSKNVRVMLEQAKGELEGTELKILMLMLQMRGQFDRSGGPMLSKSSQTDGVLIVQNQAMSTGYSKILRTQLHDNKSMT